MPNNWIRGIITFIRKRGGKYDIHNYRSITIAGIIYKIWDTVLGNQLKPYLHFITIDPEMRTDVVDRQLMYITFLNKHIKWCEINLSYLIYRKNLLCAINRELLCGKLYGRGLPSNLI